MPSTSDTRPLSYFSPAPSLSVRPRPNTDSPHYRRVSVMLAQALPERRQRPSNPHRLIRPVSCVGDFIRDMRSKESIKTPLRNVSPPTTPGSDRSFSPGKILLRIKTKRSMSTLHLAAVSDQQPSPSDSNVTPLRDPSPTTTHNATSDLGNASANINWIRRDGTTLHPYPHEAPYMQSYDPILLENDRYTELLLQRLTPPDSPTFHDYGSKPPQAILDLGCGQGHWVLAAAEVWKTSQFIGFDLVDLTSHAEKPDNVTFVRGNFLKKRLPFANKQFDLVRMANLSLCVSQAKWESLLMDVFRVLAVGGRLELIDDQTIFPYGPTPDSGPNRLRRTSQETLDLDDSDDEDTLDWSVETDSTLVNESDSCEEKLNLNLNSKTLSTRVPASPTIDWSAWMHQAEQCRQVETIFENMLRENYGINPRPSEFLPDVMNFIFGKGVEKQSTFHLKLAPPDADEFFGVSSRINTPEDSSDREDWTTHNSDPNLGFPMQRKASIRTERNTEKKGRNTDIPGHDLQSVSDRVSAKAAGRLGITYSALAAATAASVRSRAQTTRTQSPGLVLWPATYLPMSPLEVEMHACKNLHVLLGCKHAIGTYMQSFEENDGRKCMDGRVVRDVLWEYECFRRNRFHWPADVPDVRLDVHHIRGAKGLFSKSRPSLKISSESSICPFTEDELTHVRTIHVFEAIKTDDYSLASLQFPRYPAPAPPNSN